MDNLIEITQNKIGDTEINSVNARDLWRALESKQDFSNWIKGRLSRTRYVEGIDFYSFDKIIERTKGASVAKEYIISIDMAKNFAMMEQTHVGDRVRRYFIEV
jgi:anti-repressor protein